MAIELKGEVYLNPEEAAELTKFAKNSIYQYHKEWGWKAYKYGPYILFKKSELEKWMLAKIELG